MIEQFASASSSASTFGVRAVCATLEVSPSSFYAHRHKAERPRRREDLTLAVAVQGAFEQSGGTYGSPRLVRALRGQGIFTSKTRIRRLMKSHGLCPLQSHGLCPLQKRRVRVRTTRSNPHLPVAPHRLLGAPPSQQPGERFHSDITYIPTKEGWLYLAATVDGYSRKCSGWSADDNMETPLVLRAARRALETPLAGNRAAFHHSDRGSQYASGPFRAFLEQQNVLQSMSRRGNCYDHALMESFWATLKTECFDNFRNGIPATRQEARQKIFLYIELFYNSKRLHSALGYRSPANFEEKYYDQKENNPLLCVSTQSAKDHLDSFLEHIFHTNRGLYPRNVDNGQQ
jgi:transposase InsO family protein